LPLLTALLFEQAFVEAAELVMQPWFAFCRVVTSEAWQTQGNILLGLSWMFSGVFVYASLIGVVGVAFLEMRKKQECSNET
jgi:hypothetical protein